ncbi:MAG: endonuclease/exonuclease/phosphatase family protein [Alphaproteobacteria bacterium]|nr:endonuclease/exonuclease/phosphatase family protein [Alphaproteobacteria bacterium]
MTWNVHGCVGTDRRHDVARIGRVIEDIAPDIAAFQEVDSRRRAPKYGDIYTYLRGRVGDHGRQAWSISGDDGNYGQILASRYEFADHAVHDISVPGREPRKVIEAWIRTPAMPFRVLATHLGIGRRERRRQAARIREIIAQDLTTPLVLLGDLNEWNPAGAVWKTLAPMFPCASRLASFPARFPTLALDRILIRPAGSRAQFLTVREARPASDHLPVIADLDLTTVEAAP